MISRIWHGWTSPANASAYENLLRTEIFPSIENKGVKGFRKITLMKRSVGNEVEFITNMLFDDIEAVREFAGEDYEKAYVPQKAREVLSRFDPKSQHYKVLLELSY